MVLSLAWLGDAGIWLIYTLVTPVAWCFGVTTSSEAFAWRLAYEYGIWLFFSDPRLIPIGKVVNLIGLLRALDYFSSRATKYFLAIVRGWNPHPDKSTFIAGVPCDIVESDHKSKATCLYLHGGAYFGDTTQYEPMLLRLIVNNTLKMRIVIVKYRLVPEHLLGASLQDCLAVYKKMTESNRRKVLLLGVSAGGHLALRLQNQISIQGLPKPMGIALFSPWIDMTFQTCPTPIRKKFEVIKEIFHIAVNSEDASLSARLSTHISPRNADARGSWGSFASYDDSRAVECTTEGSLDGTKFDYSACPPVWGQMDHDAVLDFIPPFDILVGRLEKEFGVKCRAIRTRGLWHAVCTAFGSGVPEVEEIREDLAKWIAGLAEEEGGKSKSESQTTKRVQKLSQLN